MDWTSPAWHGRQSVNTVGCLPFAGLSYAGFPTWRINFSHDIETQSRACLPETKNTPDVSVAKSYLTIDQAHMISDLQPSESMIDETTAFRLTKAPLAPDIGRLLNPLYDTIFQ
jgi:hypothetical protein